MTGKKKGAGLLRQPELLRQLLDGIFDALPDMKISVKTRIGWERAEEWPALLALLETYPICRLTVHPRVRTQFYKGTADRGGVPLDGRAHSAASVLQRGRHHRP